MPLVTVMNGRAAGVCLLLEFILNYHYGAFVIACMIESLMRENVEAFFW